MRTILTFLIVIIVSGQLHSQANTFPSTGNAGIGNTTPPAPLSITKNGADDLGSSPRSILQLLNGSSGKGLYLGYDNSEQLGTIYPQGSSSGIAFWSHNGSSWGERLRIHTNGNIGIGTQTPSFPLHVVGDAWHNGAINFGSSSNPTRNQLQTGFARFTAPNDLNTLDITVQNSQIWIGSNFFGGGSSIPIAFNTYPYSDQLFLATNGTVGVGTTSPGEKFQVSGGRIYANGIGTSTGFALNNWSMYQASTNAFQLKYNTSDILTAGPNGNIGIGGSPSEDRLSINGSVRAKKLIISQTGWSDYVFNDDYSLKPLSQLARYIKQHKHLPDIPSEKDVMENGISVGDNQALLLKKIEELTLYLIQLQNKVDTQANDLKKLKAKG